MGKGISGMDENRRTIKTSLVGHVIDQENAHRTTVVGCCDCAEALLAGSVPYLQLYPLAVEVNGADFEVDAYGCDERGREAIFTEAEQTARFANPGVAD